MGNLNAQSVSFNVAGTNPRCKSAFPNGVPYSGTVTAPAGAWGLVDVKFERQYEAGTNNWSFFGPPFTVTTSSLSVNYSNNTVGATPLTEGPVHKQRMRATIRYRNSSTGTILTTVVNSLAVQVNHFHSPTVGFSIDQQLPPSFPGVHTDYLCDGDLTMQPFTSISNNFSMPAYLAGTGIGWRLLIFQSNASGQEVAPLDINNCSWRNGGPPTTVYLTTPEANAAYAGCGIRPQVWVGDGTEYRLYRLEYKNDCGTHSKSVLVRHFQQPTGAQVNFGIGGSPNSDALASGGAGSTGAAETFNGQTNNTDGFLSWGGTPTSPTLVGGFSPYLTGFSFSLPGGLLGYTVKVEKKGAGGVYGSIGETTVLGSQIPITFSLNTDIALSHNGASPSVLYFFSNYNSIVGAEYRITLTGKGVCNQNPQKVGYIKIAPNCQNCLVINDNGEENFISQAEERAFDGESSTPTSMSVYPNPVSNLATIAIDSPIDGHITWTILNVDGRIIHAQDMAVVKGSNMADYNTTGLPSGNYVVSMITATGVLSKKFTKLN